jgi:hypothetical protein
MPREITGNTNATCIMIGERAAAFIQGRDAAGSRTMRDEASVSRLRAANSSSMRTSDRPMVDRI